jgi:hypothetical protein
MNFFLESHSGGDGKYSLDVNGNRTLNYNPYSKSVHNYVGTPVARYYLGNLQGYNYWSIQGIPQFSDVFSNNKSIALQQKLLSKVRGHDFNMAVAVAEGSETVKMIVAAIGSVSGCIRDLKKGNFESAARRFGITKHTSKMSTKDIAGRWLELQYGWLPLLSDVYEASRAFEVLTKSPRKSRVIVSTSKEVEFDGSQSPSLYTGLGQAKASRRIIFEMTEKMGTARQLGLSDPLTVAWEIIPYSFVIDWFLPVGSYLQNLNQIPSLKGTFITTDVLTYTNEFKWTYTSPGVLYVGGQGNGNYLTINRSVSTHINAYDVARPQFKSLQEALSPKHIYNAIALARQRVS